MDSSAIFDNNYRVFRSERKFLLVSRTTGGGVLSVFSEELDCNS